MHYAKFKDQLNFTSYVSVKFLQLYALTHTDQRAHDQLYDRQDILL